MECDCGTRQWLVSLESPEDARASDFLAMFSHEIRTPVSAVVGCVDLLRSAPLDADIAELVDGVHRSTRLLNSMIDDLIDLARLESGHLDLAEQPVALRELLDDVCATLQHQARHKGVLLLAGASPELPRWITGDVVRLRQVLTNLLSHAVKSSEGGGEVVLSATTGGTGRLLITVSADRGDCDGYTSAGLGPAVAALLVARMGGTIDAPTGDGDASWLRLVLPLVPAESGSPKASEDARALAGKRVAVAAPSPRSTEVLLWTVTATGAQPVPTTSNELMTATATVDAVVWCDDANDPAARRRADAVARAARPKGRAVMISSTDPRGSGAGQRGGPALLTAPVTPGRLAAAIRSVRTGVRGGPVEVPRLPAGRVLLAEDNDVNRGVFKRMVEMLGLECDTVGDGEAAVHAMRAARYDVVLMDVQMPKMDGLEATRRIRMVDPDTPILALTATALRGDRQRCLDAGMNAHVEKPITLPDLRAALAPYLSSGAPQAPPRRDNPVAAQKAEPAPTVVDLERLTELEEQLADRLVVLATVSEFLAELGKRRTALTEALGRGNRDALRAMAHTLKSSSALLGATSLAKSCLSVEQRADSAAAEELAELVAEIQRAADGTAEVLAAHVAQAGEAS